MRHAGRNAGLVLGTLLLMSCGGTDTAEPAPLALTTLSSRADQVSDGSALLSVTVTPNVTAHELRWRSNGQPLTAQVLSGATASMAQGVQGLVVGSNQVQADVPDGRASGKITLQSHPRSGPVSIASRCSTTRPRPASGTVRPGPNG